MTLIDRFQTLQAQLPLIGLVVRYEGWLLPVDDAER